MIASGKGAFFLTLSGVLFASHTDINDEPIMTPLTQTWDAANRTASFGLAAMTSAATAAHSENTSIT